MASNGKGVISPELDMVMLCREMKWDYFTYLAQPSWFIESLRVMNNIDARLYNKKAKSIK